MARKQATNDDLEKLATLIRQRIQSDHPTDTEVFEALTSEGYALSEHFARKVKLEANRQRHHERECLIVSLESKLPINPTLKVVKARALDAGHNLTDWQLRKVYDRLKEFPRLWSSEPSFSMKLTLPSPVDAEILKQIQAATGLSPSDSVALALRAFIQSYAVHNVGLEALVRTASKSGDLEVAPYLRMLQQFDLRRLVG